MQHDSRARFTHLVSEVVEPVRRYLFRRTDPHTADDVLSETLLVLWRRLGEVPPGDEIPWAIGVARLQLANAERASRRRDRLVAKVVTLDPPGEADIQAPDAADHAALRTALARLAPADAELLRLHAWEQLEVREIARVLGVTPNAVSIRLHRAKAKLRDHLRQVDAAPGHIETKERHRP